MVAILGFSTGEARHRAQEIVANKSEANELSSVTLSWEPIRDAVKYEVLVLNGPAIDEDAIVYNSKLVPTAGVNINLRRTKLNAENFYWTYRPLGYAGNPLADFAAPQPITSGRINPQTPITSSEYSAMTYTSIYPVYSWIPLAGHRQHEVELYRYDDGSERRIRSLRGGEFDAYDTASINTAGSYGYRVRAISFNGMPLTDWSETERFTVEAKRPVAALGDSITHGGGAINLPPSYKLYNWETYSNVPVTNLGYSGDTTADMLERFEKDVLGAAPKILVIMGGVNDYRSGIYGSSTVGNLAAIRDKCHTNGIIPVFLTVTPIAPAFFGRVGIAPPPLDWQVQQNYINSWVKRQQYHIDVSTVLSDINGVLELEYTTDGLHPDYMGKKYIGERVGEYLVEHFANIIYESPQTKYRNSN